MGLRQLGAILLVIACGAAGPFYAQATLPIADRSTKPFDAAAGWDEFESLLRAKYAYLTRTDSDVEAQLVRSRRLAVETPDAAALRKLMQQTAFTFADPHLVVGPLGPDDYSVIMTSADLDVAFVGNRLMVKDVRHGSPAFLAGIRTGHEIVSIDGIDASAAARLPFGAVLPGPTPKQLDYGAILAVNGKRSGLRHIAFRNAKRQLRRVTPASATKYAQSLVGRPLVATHMVGRGADVAVLRPANSLGNNDTIKAFDNAIAQVMNAKAIVLDMRDTPSGGNTEVGRSIIGHFVSSVRPYQMHRVPALEREFTVPRQFVEYVFPRAPHYDRPVYVLHGRWTGSMGEGIVIGMDAAATNAVTVGSDMGDLLGGLWNFDLKLSGARVDLGGEALFHVDGTPRENFVADHPLAASDTAPDGSDSGIAAVIALIEAPGP